MFGPYGGDAEFSPTGAAIVAFFAIPYLYCLVRRRVRIAQLLGS